MAKSKRSLKRRISYSKKFKKGPSKTRPFTIMKRFRKQMEIATMQAKNAALLKQVEEHGDEILANLNLGLTEEE